jgi:hypothetical protein
VNWKHQTMKIVICGCSTTTHLMSPLHTMSLFSCQWIAECFFCKIPWQKLWALQCSNFSTVAKLLAFNRTQIGAQMLLPPFQLEAYIATEMTCVSFQKEFLVTEDKRSETGPAP